MSFTVTTDKDMKGPGVHVVSPEVFNEISALGGFGAVASASEFHTHDGGLAVNADTPHFSKIQGLLGAKTEKEGAK